MTNEHPEQPNQYREQLLNNFKNYVQGVSVLEGLESRQNVAAAVQERNRIGLESLLNTPLASTGQPRFTQAQFNALTPEEQEQYAREGFAYTLTGNRDSAITAFIREPEKTLRTDREYDSKLANAVSPEFVKRAVEHGYAQGEGRKLLEDYLGLKAYRKAASGDFSDIDEDRLKAVVSRAAVQREYQSLVAQGTPERDALELSKIAALAPTEGADRDKLKDASKYIAEREEKRLKAAYGENYEAKVTAAVAGVLTGMVKSGRPEEEVHATNYLYKTFKGPGIGEQRFHEYFP